MSGRIFIDANVFMYARGSDQTLRKAAGEVLLAAVEHEQFFTDAEVFQELLHRYKAIRRWPAAAASFHEQIALMTGRIEPMYQEDVEHAAILAPSYPRLAARDLIHLAIALRVSAPFIVTADTAFDGVREVERLDPALVGDWRERVLAG